MAITARASCRVDLAGGTLDIWPLGLLHEGARTVNLAITLDARATLERRDAGYRVDLDGDESSFASARAIRVDERTALIGQIVDHYELPPCLIRTETDSPRGAGLGGSSALAIALIAAAERLRGLESTPEHRAAVARDLEARLMSLPTGRQDHFPALLGGALEITYPPGGEVVRPLGVDLEQLDRRLIVAFSGQSHFSAGNNWRVVRQRLNGDGESSRLFTEISTTAAELAPAVEAADWPAVGELMSREWSARRQLAPEISTARLERLLAAALQAGAWGGKACGAGGGGCVAVLCPADRKDEVAREIEAAGGEVLAARPDPRPVSVEPSD